MLSDLRYAFRQLLRHAGSSSIAILALAVGIGATTAIFSVVDALLLRPLPYPDAERIVTVWENNPSEGLAQDDVAPGNFLDWRERQQTFQRIAAAEPYSMDLTGDGRPEVVFGVQVTEGFFDILGVRPHLGRLLQEDDYRENAGKVGMVTHGTWQGRFGGDPGIVGRILTLDGEPHVVVGVLPRQFELGILPSAGERGFWSPKIMEGWERHVRGGAWWNVIARLREGVSLEQAGADMDRIAAALAASYPGTNRTRGITLIPLHEHLVGSSPTVLWLLLTSVVLVLAIACANVANLLLAWGAERTQEFAVRAALGAGRWRLARQLLAESLALALLGGTVGILAAYWGVDALRSLVPGGLPRMDTVAVDPRVLAFSVGLSLMTAVLCGLAPAFQLSRPELHPGLKQQRSTAGPRQRRTRQVLIAGQTALALTLLVGCGLLARSLMTLSAVHPGLERSQLVALQLFYWDDDRSREERISFFDRSLQSLKAVPGVRSAGAVSAAPFLVVDLDVRESMHVLGRPAPPPGEERHVFLTSATTDYFRTMGIPVLRGRPFSDRDRADAPAVAVINESLRRQLWPEEDPIGQRVKIEDSEAAIEIVGVVGDVLHRALDRTPRPELFLPHGQTGYGAMTFFVKTEGDPAAMVPALQQRIWSVEPMQAFYQVDVVESLISRTLAGRRFGLALVGGFAAVAVFLAGLGIYGAISFSVSRRTREVGIRMALGARSSHVLRMILRQALLVSGAGVAVGLVISLLAGGFLSRLLFGVSPRDAVSLAGASVCLLLVAVVASYFPARRAMQVGPAQALRTD